MSRYATPADLSDLAMPQGGLPPYQTAAIQQRHLDAASDVVDSYLADQVTLPLTGTVPSSIVMRACQIAAYTLLVARGYNPERGQDEQMKAAHDGAIDWLIAISKGEVKPPLTDSSPSGVADGGPDVLQVSTQQVGSMPSLPGEERVVISGGGVRIGPPRLRGF